MDLGTQGKISIQTPNDCFLKQVIAIENVRLLHYRGQDLTETFVRTCQQLLREQQSSSIVLLMRVYKYRLQSVIFYFQQLVFLSIVVELKCITGVFQDFLSNLTKTLYKLPGGFKNCKHCKASRLSYFIDKCIKICSPYQIKSGILFTRILFNILYNLVV